MTNKGVAYRKRRRRIIANGKKAFASMNLLPKAVEALNAVINDGADAMGDIQSKLMGAYNVTADDIITSVPNAYNLNKERK